MGIGGHRDHVATSLCLWANMARLEPLACVSFYEDLPYAANPALRQEGLSRFQHFMGSHRLVRQAETLPDEVFREKMNAVALYASQLPRTGWNPEIFRTESLWTPCPTS
jgi:hypothetical protein